jgi:hypothetical protein
MIACVESWPAAESIRFAEYVDREIDEQRISAFAPDCALLDSADRSRNATGSQRHRDPRLPPLAFTEHGAIMAATILNSAAAVQMSVYVVRAFVRHAPCGHHQRRHCGEAARPRIAVDPA